MRTCDKCGSEIKDVKFKTDLYIILILLICLGVTIIMMFNKIMIYKEHYKLADLDPRKLQYDLGGMSWAPGYYCVNTLGFSQKTEEKIAIHEQCHILIYKDKEHFCGVEK